MRKTETRLRHDIVSWAHYLLAISHRRDQKRFEAAGIRTIVLVDADILIGQTDLEHQRALFKDLLDPHVEGAYFQSLSAFFYEWIATSLARADHEGKALWAVSPEHFREVVNKAHERLQESLDDPQDGSPHRGSAVDIFQQLSTVLTALKSDPWSDIDKDLAELLAVLGVSSGKATRWETIESLKRWLDWLGASGRVVKGKHAADSTLGMLPWPRFESAAEVRTFRAWREHLWKARHGRPDRATASQEHQERHSSRTIDADARVLTALTVLNQGWEQKKLRVELLTGSRYVLRAVARRSLNPEIEDKHVNAFESDRMSDFVLMPSMIVAEDSLWEPLSAERDARIGTIPEWSLPDIDERASRRRIWFSSINAWGEGRSHEQGSTLVERSLRFFRSHGELGFAGTKGGSFRTFFSHKVSRSVALTQVRSRLGTQRGEQAATALAVVTKHKSSAELRAKLDELAEFRRVQLRIDMLEYLIQAHHLHTDTASSASSVNPLRAAPFVEFGNLEDARLLSDALTDTSGQANDDRTSQLKLRVYERDRTTYMLVLVYANVYARQARWKLACSAAEYAYMLSQTAEYRQGRSKRIMGDEARLLQLACLRRAATTPRDVQRAMSVLDDFKKMIPIIAQAEPMVEVRIELERASLVITDLFMEFFATGGLRDEREFRSRVGSALQDVVDLQEAFARVCAELSTQGEREGVWDDIANRIATNGCNLAWLAVAWDPNELERSKVLQPRRQALERRYGAVIVDFVKASLRALEQSAESSLEAWQDRPAHDLLSLVTASMVLEPEAMNWSSGWRRDRLTEALNAWSRTKYEHPYDAQRIAYAMTLSGKLRF